MGSRKPTKHNRLAAWLLPRVQGLSPRMRTIHIVAAILAVVFTVSTTLLLSQILGTYSQAGEKSAEYERCQRAVQQLQDASDFLTSHARAYVERGERKDLDEYIAELELTNRRGTAMNTLQEEASQQDAAKSLQEAKQFSDDLAKTELRAMRLAADSRGLTDPPDAIEQVELSQEEQAMNGEQKLSRADELVNGDSYDSLKLSIRDSVAEASHLLVVRLQSELEGLNSKLFMLTCLMYGSITLLLLSVVFVICSTMLLLLWPISMHNESIRTGKPLVGVGAKELRYLTDTYNEMYEKNHQKTESLQYEARYDALTGILNRAAYDQLLFEHRRDSALILVDVDKFKNFNDDYGHEMGDAVLVEVAATLYSAFRATDFVCRIGGDEFAVIMTGASSELRPVIEAKMNKVAAFLRDTSNDLPAVTLSVGVAFGNAESTQDSLFNAADAALYKTKRDGRDGINFSNDH